MSISGSGFPFYLLLFVVTECNIVNPTNNLQGMKLLYVCFSFGFGLLFSILIHFKTANFRKLQGVYSNNEKYIKMTMKSARSPPDLLQARQVWKQIETGE